MVAENYDISAWLRLSDHRLLGVAASASDNVRCPDKICICEISACETTELLSSTVVAGHRFADGALPGGVARIDGLAGNTSFAVPSQYLFCPCNHVNNCGALWMIPNPQLQILDAVVVADTVFVMYCLIRKQASSKMRFHHKHMLKHSLGIITVNSGDPSEDDVPLGMLAPATIPLRIIFSPSMDGRSASFGVTNSQVAGANHHFVPAVTLASPSRKSVSFCPFPPQNYKQSELLAGKVNEFHRLLQKNYYTIVLSCKSIILRPVVRSAQEPDSMTTVPVACESSCFGWASCPV